MYVVGKQVAKRYTHNYLPTSFPMHFNNFKLEQVPKYIYYLT